MNGTLIVSLDYELFWGMQDVTTTEQYRDPILGTYTAIPRLLNLFHKYGIHSTWATVGMIHARNVKEAEVFWPDELPSYKKRKRSVYRCMKYIRREKGALDAYFFAPKMIEKIAAYEGTEIASHTFSHYYCDEKGQTVLQFEKDLESDERIRGSMMLSSFVFPRNQSLDNYISILKKHGIHVYRGVEDNWIHRVRPEIWMRFLRLADTYIPLSGTNEYFPVYESGMINLHGSRMFKPYNKKLSVLEGLKMKRIKGQMLHAAKNHLVFHLWWHPHNVGINQEENFKQLETVFAYYEYLHKKYGFQSMNMKEAAEYYKN